LLFADDARHDLARLDADRLVDDALLIGVVAHLDMPGHREVLAERVADEAVVGEDAAQIHMAGNTMPKRSKASRSNQLAAGQTSTAESTDREIVVGEHLHAETLVVLDAQQLGDDRKR
jgi:hypothetical protein